MKLSNQAKGALLMALQQCMLEEIDIIKLLDEMDFSLSEGELVCLNPTQIDLSKAANPLLREGFKSLTIFEE